MGRVLILKLSKSVHNVSDLLFHGHKSWLSIFRYRKCVDWRDAHSRLIICWFRSYRDPIAPSGVLRLATLGVELLWHDYWHQPWLCPSKRFTWWFLIVKSQQNVTELVTRLEQRRVRALRELSAFWSQPSHRWPNGGGIRMHGRNSLHYTALQKDKRQLPTDKRDHVGGAGGICGSISGSDKKQAFDKIEKRRHFIHTWLPFHSVNAGIRTFWPVISLHEIHTYLPPKGQ